MAAVRTEFVWTDERGMVALRHIKGSSNPNDIGEDTMIADMVGYISENMPYAVKRMGEGNRRG